MSSSVSYSFTLRVSKLANTMLYHEVVHLSNTNSFSFECSFESSRISGNAIVGEVATDFFLRLFLLPTLSNMMLLLPGLSGMSGLTLMSENILIILAQMLC